MSLTLSGLRKRITHLISRFAPSADHSATLAEIKERQDRADRTVAEIAARLPPVGWRPSNLTCDARPELSLCRDCVTGRWSIWAPGQQVVEGATMEECIRALRNVRP